MRYLPTPVSGAFIVQREPRLDNRGSFSRIVCVEEFAAVGLDGSFAQVNIHTNERAGIIRGLHLQGPPHGEAKLVLCIRGAIFDVGVDVREDSPTKGAVVTARLSAEDCEMLFLPPGCAHGYQTLEDGTEVVTFHSVPYAPETEICFRWDEPKFAIPWPLPEPTLSEKDRAHRYL